MKAKKLFFEENIDKIKKLINRNVPLLRISKEFNFKYATFKKYLDLFHIEYSTNSSSRGFVKKITKNDLSRYLNNEQVINASALRDKLIRAGLKDRRCECCGNTEWLDQPIPLELHHKNENHYDNSLDNLEILCSNCHSVKHGYGQSIKHTVEDVVGEVKINRSRIRKKKENVVKHCSVCGKPIQENTKTGKCQKCIHIDQRKVEWPTREELIQLHSQYSNVKIGKMYGVSDKSISKWLKHYNIV